jgi:hypothetical protein
MNSSADARECGCLFIHSYTETATLEQTSDRHSAQARAYDRDFGRAHHIDGSMFILPGM